MVHDGLPVLVQESFPVGITAPPWCHDVEKGGMEVNKSDQTKSWHCVSIFFGLLV